MSIEGAVDQRTQDILTLWQNRLKRARVLKNIPHLSQDCVKFLEDALKVLDSHLRVMEHAKGIARESHEAKLQEREEQEQVTPLQAKVRKRSSLILGALKAKGELPEA
jgi:hypothetical protein